MLLISSMVCMKLNLSQTITCKVSKDSIPTRKRKSPVFATWSVTHILKYVPKLYNVNPVVKNIAVLSQRFAFWCLNLDQE